jgi:hypothetical protein
VKAELEKIGAAAVERLAVALWWGKSDHFINDLELGIDAEVQDLLAERSDHLL